MLLLREVDVYIFFGTQLFYLFVAVGIFLCAEILYMSWSLKFDVLYTENDEVSDFAVFQLPFRGARVTGSAVSRGA